jgi:hypothetical protein
VAPSGGRDRPDAAGQWLPHAFDAGVVDLMRSLLANAKRPGHLFPLAMHSGEMMPPPPALEKQLGERRLTSFVPVGARARAGAGRALGPGAPTGRAARGAATLRPALVACEREQAPKLAMVANVRLRVRLGGLVTGWGISMPSTAGCIAAAWGARVGAGLAGSA